ncbi:hypothetical protein NC652_001612 [Populus alba x Populus x berolinensis]|uniref:Uncharacterized protein n=1 Tax=Populus alba x Populus x berolinensis TaxID=444605 RepID=A0AAD6WGT8_9ROSI|nr:hypothetical protein NC652_001612 [Populus alba x Populus x berolinensis]KAJ7011286.1 hypothetical protein NC653_001654 [Populus alba x Populus x berolinensis]
MFDFHHMVKLLLTQVPVPPLSSPLPLPFFFLQFC